MICNCAFCEIVREVAPDAIPERESAGDASVARVRMPTRSEFKTQKVKGLFALQEGVGLNRVQTVSFQAFTEVEQLEFAHTRLHRFNFPVFGRPAPVEPRHGFVDSKECNNLDELIALFNEAKAEERDAELIVASLIKATHNAVWACGQLTIGYGNDGATSGRDCIVIPTLTELSLRSGRNRLMQSIKESPYLEFVYVLNQRERRDSNVAYITQLRDGPKIGSGDYIPRSMRIEEVVKVDSCDSDPRALLSWEKRVKEFSRGTVVWHPGGSLASHYAVHCKLSEVPVIISHEPKVGGVLNAKATVRKVPKVRDFITGVKIGLFQRDLHYMTSSISVVLSILHNFVAYDVTNPLHAKLAGIACGLTIRLGFLASLGEARHARDNRLKLDNDRNKVYEKHWIDFLYAKRRVPQTLACFRDKKIWGGRGSFGGKAWAGCLEETINLWNCVCDVHARKKTINDAMAILNKVINRAHNTGRFLNKFTGEDFFTEAAHYPVSMAIWAAPWMDLVARMDVEGVSKDFRRNVASAAGEFKAAENPTEKKRLRSLFMVAKAGLKSVVGYKVLFKAISDKDIAPGEENFDEERIHFTWVQCNIRAGDALHFQYKFAEMPDYQTHTVVGNREALAAMIWRAKDNQRLYKSFASSNTEYVKFNVVRNRYFVIFNNTLNRWVTVLDYAEIDSSCRLKEYEEDGKYWDYSQGKVLDKPKPVGKN